MSRSSELWKLASLTDRSRIAAWPARSNEQFVRPRLWKFLPTLRARDLLYKTISFVPRQRVEMTSAGKICRGQIAIGQRLQIESRQERVVQRILVRNNSLPQKGVEKCGKIDLKVIST